MKEREREGNLECDEKQSENQNTIFFRQNTQALSIITEANQLFVPLPPAIKVDLEAVKL